LGAEYLTEASSRTNEVAGDGTTTSMVLAQALITFGLEAIKTGEKVSKFIETIKKDTEIIVENLEKAAKKIKTKKEKQDIASISANNRELGDVIGDLYHQVGNNGSVVAENSDKVETTTEVIDGFRFNAGYVSQYFINHPMRETFEVKDPHILITNLELKNFHDLIDIVNKVINETQSRNFVIIGDQVTGTVVTDLIINNQKGATTAVAIEKPYFGIKGDKNQFMEDLALVTGGRFIDKDKNELLKELAIEDLGTCERIIVKKNQTIIVNGGGEKKKIKTELILLAGKDQTKVDIKERIARLGDKVAVMKIGAQTKTELQEKRYRVQDSIESTKAALEEGVIQGGGLALVNASKDIKGVMRDVCLEPFKQIIRNIDKDPKDIISEVRGDQGYDAREEEFVDVWKEGIIDPLKVTKAALLNAVSISIEILKTEAVVMHIDGPKKDSDQEDGYEQIVPSKPPIEL
jgi:chaperonin GroEL